MRLWVVGNAQKIKPTSLPTFTHPCSPKMLSLAKSSRRGLSVVAASLLRSRAPAVFNFNVGVEKKHERHSSTSIVNKTSGNSNAVFTSMMAPTFTLNLLFFPAMFCQQCEQTESGKGCSTIGVCGKTPEVAHLQDALVHALKGLGVVASLARSVNIIDSEVDRFMLRATFSTLTNVNFDAAYFHRTVPEAIARRNALWEAYKAECKAKGTAVAALPSIASWNPDVSALEAAGASVGLIERRDAIGVESM